LYIFDLKNFYLYLGRVHTTQSNTNTSQIDKSGKHTRKLVIAGANPSKPLEPPEKAL
jgi:hypothetical protein